MSDDESERKRAAAASVVRHLHAMAHQRRKEHEAREAEITPAPIVEGQKFSTREICRYLAWAKLDPDFRVPAAIIDAVALRITSKRVWAKEQAEAKKSDAALLLRAVRAEADKVRAEYPRFRNNDSWIAEKVVKRLDGRLTKRGRDGERVPVTLNRDTVRRQVSQTR